MADNAPTELAKGILNELTPTGMADIAQKIDPQSMWQALQAYFGVGRPEPGNMPYNPNMPEAMRRQQLQGIQQQMQGPTSQPGNIAPGELGAMMKMMPPVAPAGMPIPPSTADKTREIGPAYKGNPRRKK